MGKEMNKKGVFVTITAILILAVIFLFLNMKTRESGQVSELNIQYTKHRLISDSVEDLKDVQLPSMIQISQKRSLISISDWVDSTPGGRARLNDLPANLTSVIMTGDLGGSNLINVEDTLPYLVNLTFNTVTTPFVIDNFDFKVIGIRHLDPYIVGTNCSFNFTISSTNTTTTIGRINVSWSDSVEYIILTSVNGMVDPETGRLIRTDDFSPNSTKSCVLKTISINYSDCLGVSGLCHSILGC
jgi:hypothetical protein